MSNTIKPKFKTLAYAGNAEFLKLLTEQLDELKLFTKKEEGSQHDSDGHVISYVATVPGVDQEIEIFWAMINSDHKHYLIRADENLFEVA